MPATEETELEALHVVVDKAAGEKDVAADWGSWQTFQLTPTTPPQQIIPQNDKRKQARLIVASFPVNGGASQSASGQALAPTSAGQLITTLTLQPGTYLVNWGVQPYGTVAAGEQGNFQLMLNGVQIAVSGNAQTAGTFTSQIPATVVVTQPNSTLTVNTINAGTSTANYRANVGAVQTAGAGGAKVGTRAQIMNGQGGVLAVGGMYTVENKQELWAGSDGINSTTLTVLDERYE